MDQIRRSLLGSFQDRKCWRISRFVIDMWTCFPDLVMGVEVFDVFDENVEDDAIFFGGKVKYRGVRVDLLAVDGMVVSVSGTYDIDPGRSCYQSAFYISEVGNRFFR